MKTNPEGLSLIAAFQDEYAATESRTSAEKAVNALINLRINSNQFSALVSLIISIGIDDFKKKYVKLINKIEGSASVLCKIVDLWRMEVYEINDNGDRILDPFLKAQRDCEIDLFIKPEQTPKRKSKKCGS
jgi:GH24 family phage-related lysozyme (muramidase)